MRDHLLLVEAFRCRVHARKFAGKPEGAFLLRAAETFEELSDAAKRTLCMPQQPGA